MWPSHFNEEIMDASIATRGRNVHQTDNDPLLTIQINRTMQYVFANPIPIWPSTADGGYRIPLC
jgi:hypothetical protein